ncbi:RagB/SusD family nutrient uptake outer membrane protein [Rhodothermus marinus]|uniref:RagB/SusD family nutrient uptake outer membrane protein n=1 Tax=Rhodothermus marinus TaxID=29549 RepID=UPI001375026E|nr:RagB/SusD family nutrient uptake outer membrane protein [Rhodothermus marinus]
MRPIHFVALLLLVGGLSACGEDFTMLAPPSQKNAADFYQTPEDFQQAIFGVYDALQQRGTFNMGYWIAGEMRSDNTDAGDDVTGLAAQLAALDTFDELPTNDYALAIWADSYRGVARANVILARLPAADLPADLKALYEGEALFLRSLFYYYLAQIFCNIPLILDETTSPDQPVNQVPASEVYAQLMQDLTRAEELLPVRYPQGQEGRATKGAAATLLAKVYLIVGDRGRAATVLRRIIDNYGYQLVPDYADLWGPENENNPESIFEVQYKAGGFGEGSPFVDQFVPWSTATSGQTGNRPTLDMQQAYEEGDLRFMISMDTSYVDADGETQQARYIKKYISQPFALFDAENNFIVFRYADVLLMLAEALGESPEAYALINQVRQRAGLPPIGPDTPGTFEEKLLHERRVELAFENHRWFDLLRFGRAMDVMQAKGFRPKQCFPIPQREIDVSHGVLQQNPEHE